MGQGVRDGQWYGRPKQEGGAIGLIMMFVFFVVGIWGGFIIMVVLPSFIGFILGISWGLYWILSFFTKLVNGKMIFQDWFLNVVVGGK